MKLNRLLVYIIILVFFSTSPVLPQVEQTDSSLKGEFTVRYRAIRGPIDSVKSTMARPSRAEIRKFLQFNYTKQGIKLSEAQIEQMTRQLEQVAPPSTNSVSFILTLSGHNGSFLYELLTEENPKKVHSGVASLVSVCDGAQTFGRYYTDNFFGIRQGLHAEMMPYMPVFCAGYASIPLLKALSAEGNSKYTGEALYPGIQTIYLPVTVRAVLSQGAPRFDNITLNGSGHPLMEWRLSKHIRFHSVWIPSQVEETEYTSNGSGAVSPRWTCKLTLLSLQDKSVDVARFDANHSLRKDMTVYAEQNGKKLAFGYNPKKSLEVQEQEADVLQKEVALKSQQGLMASRTSTGLWLFLALVFGIACYSIWRRTRKAR